MSLRAGLVLLLAVLPAEATLAPPARAGPVEARRLWERAKSLAGAPWRERAAAYRATIAAANPTDGLRARAWAALADVLRDAGHAHGGAAAECAATLGLPRSDGSRVRALHAHATALRAEGDVEAADAVLREVVRDARSEAPRTADQALDVLAEDAFDRGDEAEVLRWLAAARADGAAPALEIRLLGRAGLLRLAAGDRVGAAKRLTEAERVHRAAQSGPEDAANAATKAWLDLSLRDRLP